MSLEGRSNEYRLLELFQLIALSYFLMIVSQHSISRLRVYSGGSWERNWRMQRFWLLVKGFHQLWPAITLSSSMRGKWLEKELIKSSWRAVRCINRLLKVSYHQRSLRHMNKTEEKKEIRKKGKNKITFNYLSIYVSGFLYFFCKFHTNQ